MISLIVATMHRTAELERLLTSLNAQSFRDFEVLIVDQNADGRLDGILSKFSGLRLRHFRCQPGASRARNLGLREAAGNIIGFPDDDCWYAEDVLQVVSDWFGSHPDSDGLLGILRDEHNAPTGPKWPQQICPATRATLWSAGITPIAFLSRRAVQAVGFFDERIGPGAVSGYHSGEDLNYLLRCVEQGFRLWHDPQLTVRHPSFHNPDRIREKSYSYALGGGFALRSHHYPLRTLVQSLIRSAGAAILYFCKGDFQLSRSYALRAAGVLRGYIFGRRDLEKAAP